MRATGSILIALLLASSAWFRAPAATCPVSYSPAGDPGYPPRVAVPVALGEVVDARGPDGAALYETPAGALHFARPLADIVKLALEIELTRAGMHVVDPGEGTALVLDCTIEVCRAVRGPDDRADLSVSLEFRWRDPSSGAVLETNERTAERSLEGGASGDRAPCAEIGQALVGSLLYSAITKEIRLGRRLSRVTTQSDNRQYEQARAEDTIESFKTYLQNCPRGKYVLPARERLEVLAYTFVKMDGNVADFGRFLEEYPDSKFADVIRERYKELSQLDSVEQEERPGIIEAYRRYLEDYPRGKFRPAVAAKHDSLSYVRAEELGSMAGYADYLEHCPDGRHAADAAEALSFLRAREADTVAAYQAHVNRYPGGRYAEQTRLALQGLPLYEACLRGDANAVERLLASGRNLADLTQATQALLSILQDEARAAASSGAPRARQRILGLLLRAGADPLAMRVEGFQIASERTLVQPGGIVAKGEGGLSALAFAEFFELKAYKQMLLDAGVEP